MHQPIINCYEVEQMLLHQKRRNKFVIAAPISICCPEPDTDNALSLPEHNHLGRHWLCTVDLKPLLWIHNPVKIYISLQSFQFMPDNILNCIPCVPCQTNIIQTVQCDYSGSGYPLIMIYSQLHLRCQPPLSCPLITSENLGLSKLSY